MGASVRLLFRSGGVGRGDLPDLAEGPCEEVPINEVVRCTKAGRDGEAELTGLPCE